MNQHPETLSVRLDKWLWAARFFKTRKLAVEAIKGGKVHLNGQRTKAGKEIKLDSQLRIHKGSLEWNVCVLVLAKQRRPASEAIHFYRESEDSVKHRLHTIQQEKIIRQSMPRPTDNKPSKKGRRLIHHFTRKE